MMAAVAALGLAGGLSAQPRGPHGDGGIGAGAARFLELTEDQQARLAELREQGRPERERLRELSREANRRFREALEAESPDPAEVGQAAIDMHALRQQQRTQGESFQNAFEGLLTSEQLRKWEMMQASRAAGGGPGRGRRGPRGPGGTGRR
jgi:Spy/CpxP family protein refolding chaperone